MKVESTEELRARLLTDERLRLMIATRAFEIYELRGRAPGRDAEDWLQAEAELLAFAIEDEARRSAAKAAEAIMEELRIYETSATEVSVATPEVERLTQPTARAATAAAKASSPPRKPPEAKAITKKAPPKLPPTTQGKAGPKARKLRQPSAEMEAE